MTLRTRLLLGLSVFVGALVALGAWSASHLWRMSALSERIIAENYDSVVAAQDMKESLERQDSAALFVLLERWDRALQQVRDHRARFDAAYRRAANNITEPGEADIIRTIGANRDEYYRRFDRFLLDAKEGGSTGRRPAELAAGEYFGELEPLFTKLRGQCDRLLNLNQDAMRRKAAEAATLARRWFVATLETALALVLGGIWFAILLSNSIVRPVRQLTDAANRMAAGQLDPVVDIHSRDEIGTLAAQFNEMAARIRQLRQSDLGKVLVAQQTAEAAVDSLYDPVIVTDGAGRIQRINRAAETLFGPEVAVIGKAVKDIANDPRLSMAVLDVLESQKPVASEESAAIVPLQPGQGTTFTFTVPAARQVSA
jgi:two-component system, NtrC family, sensor histidine kinase KinB